MWPVWVELAGTRLDIWNIVFLVAIVAGFPVLLASVAARVPQRHPRALPLRWLITVYGSALGAQWLAYLVDLNTTVLPPAGFNPLRYYLDPLFGPKTLYGAILILPLTIALITFPWRDLRYGEALDSWTPPMFVVLGICRIGCFLQGCCYGVQSNMFGIAFPPNGPLYHEQLHAGLIEHGAHTLPVVPTQVFSALVLFALAAWSFHALRRGRSAVFPISVGIYSLWRFIIEFLRADPERNAFGALSSSQWVALAVVAIVALSVSRRGALRTP